MKIKSNQDINWFILLNKIWKLKINNINWKKKTTVEKRILGKKNLTQ